MRQLRRINRDVVHDVISDNQENVVDGSDSDADEILDENDQALATSSSESEAEEVFEHDEGLADLTFGDFLIQWYYENDIKNSPHQTAAWMQKIQSNTLGLAYGCENSSLNSKAGNYSYPYGSPVEHLVDPLNQVPLYPMHQLNLEVTKRHLNLLLNALGNVGDDRLMANIDADFKSLTRWTPCEFNRKIRSITEFIHYKATELRTLLLYAAPVVFSKYMSAEAMLHFNSLNLAARILSDPDQCFRNNNFAKQLLTYYVEQTRYLYGDHMLVYNVHDLSHLSDKVLRFVPLDGFSAIGFEGYLCIIKKMLKNGTNILSQIVNRVNEMAINQIRIRRASREGLLQGKQFILIKPKHANNLPRGYYFAHEKI
ncbi:hypothetical protein QAD02_007607 [Eretmocerus hayati]|uniref:Uncharacterized protein n=1 Tax=Eretmocerus hayati TaxID=131215 RepID=A0ACC2N438_9HYME|nr:hypothetical protein QAD02_007607 [Eretmocerus hayati]